MTSDPRAERRSTRNLPLPRDTQATAFTALLADLIARVPGARGAALVDRDGESIDYAGSLPPFDVKIAAAHWQIVLGEFEQAPLFSRPRSVTVRGSRRSFIVHPLDDGYSVVLILAQRAGFVPVARAFVVFERALHAEAGIGSPRPGPQWTDVIVASDERGRPQALATSASSPLQQLDVLGAVMGLGRGERGFRVRFATGFETTLVREPGGAWYTDEPIEQSARPR